MQGEVCPLDVQLQTWFRRKGLCTAQIRTCGLATFMTVAQAPCKTEFFRCVCPSCSFSTAHVSAAEATKDYGSTT